MAWYLVKHRDFTFYTLYLFVGLLQLLTAGNFCKTSRSFWWQNVWR